MCGIKFFIIFIALSNCLFAVNKERLNEFFKDYHSSNAQSLDKLPYAVENGYEDVAEFFVLNGEPINYYSIDLGPAGNQKNIYRKHPLITSIKKSYLNLSINIIKTTEKQGLISEGKTIYKYYQSCGWTRHDNVDQLYALQAAIDSPVGYSIIEELIKSSINLNIVYCNLNSNIAFTLSTPLIRCVLNNKLDIAKLLLEYGADANLSTEQPNSNAPLGISPLYIAVNDDNKEAIELLLSYGADPLKKIKNRVSPLELAIEKEQWDTVNLFLNIMNHDRT